MSNTSSRKRHYSLMTELPIKKLEVKTEDSAFDMLTEMKGDVEVWKDYRDRLISSDSNQSLQKILHEQIEHTQSNITRVENMLKSCRNKLRTRKSVPVFNCSDDLDVTSSSCYSFPLRPSTEPLVPLIHYTKRRKEDPSLISRFKVFSFFSKLFNHHDEQQSPNLPSADSNDSAEILSEELKKDDSQCDTSEDAKIKSKAAWRLESPTNKTEVEIDSPNMPSSQATLESISLADNKKSTSSIGSSSSQPQQKFYIALDDDESDEEQG